MPKLDELTASDLAWFVDHPATRTRYRKAQAVEMVRINPDQPRDVCLDEGHYRILVTKLSDEAVARFPIHNRVECSRLHAISEVSADTTSGRSDLTDAERQLMQVIVSEIDAARMAAHS